MEVIWNSSKKYHLQAIFRISKNSDGDYQLIDKKRTKIDKKNKIIKTFVYFIKSDKTLAMDQEGAARLGMPTLYKSGYSYQHEVINYGESMRRNVLYYRSVDCSGNEIGGGFGTSEYVIQGTAQEEYVKNIMDVLKLR